MLKRCLAIFIAVVFVIGFTACGSQQQAAKDSTGSGAQQSTAETQKTETKQEVQNIELHFAWWGAEARHNKFNTILDMYEKQNPHIKIIRQYAPWNDYWTKLATQAAGGTLPDSFGMTAMNKGEYASKGVMEDLQPYVDKGLIDISKFSKGSLEAGMYKGKLYMITFGDSGCAFVYNKGLIESVGMTPPKDEMTWDEHRDYLIALQAKLPEGVYAGNDDARFEHAFENFVRQKGYELTTEDGKQVGYPKEVVAEYFGFWKSLVDAGVIPPAQVTAEQTGLQWADTLMAKSKIATWYTNINQLPIYQLYVKEELGAVRAPILKDAKRKYVELLQPSSWCIATNSKYKDEVAKLISWFVNDVEAQKVFDMELGAPGSSAIREMLVSNFKADDKIHMANKRVLEVMDLITSTVEAHPGRAPGAPALISDITKKYEEFSFGKLTADQAAEAHINAVSSILQ